ncbi:MAG: sugar phosphate isomerase/epimerase [bacterium]|nr:sugar phosphate isomerase/epimerase [bacterium]
MKKSINTGVLPDTIKFEDGLKIIREAGFDAVEISAGESGCVLDINCEENNARKIAETIRKNGLEISGLFTRGLFGKFPLSSPDPAKRKKGEEVLEKAIRIAYYVETDALLVIPGIVSFFTGGGEIVSYDIVYKNSQEAIKRYVEIAEKLGVYICIENVWNKFLLSPLEMKRYVEEFNSDYVRIYFDVGNVLFIGFPEMWIRILGKLIKRVHFKDFKLSVGNINGFCDLLEGDVNWLEVMKALKDINYDGYLTAEVDSYKYCPESKIYNTSLAMDKILVSGKV